MQKHHLGLFQFNQFIIQFSLREFLGGFNFKMASIDIGMLHYVLDNVYGAFMHRSMLSPHFISRGWGGTKLDLSERMIKQLFPSRNWPPCLVQLIWKTVEESKAACLREEVFRTPRDWQLLSALPPESRSARVSFLAPGDEPAHHMA